MIYFWRYRFAWDKKNAVISHSGLFQKIYIYCAVPENIHTPLTEGIGISWGVGGSVRPKNLKKCMKLNWKGWGWGVLEKIPSVGEVWIFSGISRYSLEIQNLDL